MRLGLARLGDHIEILSGYAFKSDFFNSEGLGVPLVRIRDVVPRKTNTFFSGEYDIDFLIDDGDLLIGMDGEFNCACWNGGPSLLNQRVCRIRTTSEQLDDRYLFRFLPMVLKSIEYRTPFVTVKHLSVKDLREIEISLPPLDEQRRIAAILDQADDLQRKRRHTLERLDNLRETIFVDMFVESERLDWPIERVADIAIDMRTGPFGSQLLHSEFVEEGIAVLGIDNAVRNEFRWDERRFITAKKYRALRRYTVRPGDVLITLMGTCGRCAVVPDNIPIAINTKHLCCITLNTMKVLPAFLHASFLQHPSVLKQLGVQAKGAVMPGLNMSIIKSLELRIPPIDLQRAFALRIEALDEVRASCREHKDHLDALFASLQYLAFRGELNSKDAERELAMGG